MAGMLLHVGASILCAHGGQAQVAPGAPRVRLGGQPAASMADLYPVAACPLNVSGAPQPCLKIDWITPAARVRIGGQPAVLSVSTGFGVGAPQAPQGPASVVASQTRARGQ